MASIFEDFKEGQRTGSGPRLAAALTPVAPAELPNRLLAFYYFSNAAHLSSDLRYALFQANGIKLPKQEQNGWVDIFSAYWKAVGEIAKFDESPSKASWVKVFDAWKEVSNALIRGYSNFGLQAWTVPCLYVVGKYLRTFAIRADAELSSQGSVTFGDRFQEDIAADFTKSAKLEEAAWVINRMFTLCLSDRSPIEESRKWGIYNMTNLLFKTYFKINSVGLTKNLLRALNASSADLPGLDAFPRSHIVTFNYYVGVINFLDENYEEAESHLADAWNMCHKDSLKNRENGDLREFDAAMSAGEEEFVKRRIYLPLERGRDIALRNLFRKVFIVGGFEESKDGQAPIRRTRVPVAEFSAALRIGTHASDKVRIDMDEVECLLSNLIYKGLMKGYIARERGMVVLSKGGTAFPGTGV
ncbi:hypothetical protein EYZ11_002904 [Aspergillus tanneri]|uniref:Protein CSN12 homolog n=1 Tax=Aspergillus tanneri TaxID=1220188 RepID=A0A4V3UQ42_9EURO|nr:hypothetical protein EYZ11_002904 [Aspergillus tanneri]